MSTSRARLSLTPAWVTNKQAQLASMAEMYGWLPAAGFGIEAGVVGDAGPGYWTGAGQFSTDDVPADAAGASGITASPATAWDTGNYLHTSAHKGRIYYDGAAWQDGVAP